jgi:DNA-binding protein HU-beta
MALQYKKCLICGRIAEIFAVDAYSCGVFMGTGTVMPDKYRYYNQGEVAKMTKTEVVAKVAEEIKVPKTVAAKALDAVLDSITQAIHAGDKVSFTGFGTFSVVKREARTGRNPQTGKEIKIEAKKVPKFSAGVTLRAAAEGKAKAKQAAKAATKKPAAKPAAKAKKK